jgi:hypothetical protein
MGAIVGVTLERWRCELMRFGGEVDNASLDQSDASSFSDDEPFVIHLLIVFQPRKVNLTT